MAANSAPLPPDSSQDETVGIDASGVDAAEEPGEVSADAPPIAIPAVDPAGLLFAAPPVPAIPPSGPMQSLAAAAAASPSASVAASSADETGQTLPDAISHGSAGVKQPATVFDRSAPTGGDGSGAGDDTKRDQQGESKGRGTATFSRASANGAAAGTDHRATEGVSGRAEEAAIASSGESPARNAPASSVRPQSLGQAAQPSQSTPSKEVAGKDAGGSGIQGAVTLTPAARDALAPLLQLANRVADAALPRGLESPAPTPQPGAEEDNPTTPLVGRGLAALANQKGGALQIRLDPPSLGDLRIAMTVVNGKVTAELTTSTGQAHALLSADLTSLRQALEAQGLSVDRLSVQHAPPPTQQHQSSVRGEAAPPSMQQTQQQGAAQNQSNGSEANAQDRGQQQRHDAGHGQSRGRSSHGGDGGERDSGSKSRRRASFARVFEASNLP